MTAQLNFSAFLSCVARRNDEIRRVQNLRASPPQYTEVLGNIWEQVKEKQAFPQTTNFTEHEVLDIVRTAEKYEQIKRTRGPKPKHGVAESILLLLAYYDHIAAWFHVKSSTLADTLQRGREYLFPALVERWWKVKIRPRIVPEIPHPEIALVGDIKSAEVFRPKGHFNEAKTYWDGKNKIYALKKEVAVLRYPPHYAMFSLPSHVGGEHDYACHKQEYINYAEYLLKLPEDYLLIKLIQSGEY